MKTRTISSYYPRVVLKAARNRGLDTQALLRDARITSELETHDQVRVTISQYVRLFQRTLRLIQDESFGCLPNPMRQDTFAVACEWVINSATIEQVLNNFCRFYGVVTDDMVLQLSRADGRAVFTVALKEPEWDADHYIGDTFLSIAHRLSMWLAGKNIPLISAGFAYSSCSPLEEKMYLFPCPHNFSVQGPSYIEFNEDYLKLPVLKTEVEMQRYIRNSPTDLLSRLSDSETLSGKVYTIITRQDFSAIPESSAVAQEVFMTEQTLRRKLRAEGTSFQQIKDELRRDAAIHHLSRPKLSITQIAENLGFSTPGAFSRAFKNWVGVSPDAYRGQ